MAGESVKFTITGDSSKAVAEQKKVIAQQEATIKKLQETGRQSKRTGAEAQSAFSGMAAGLKGVATALVGPMSIVAGATAAVALFKEMRENTRALGREIAATAGEMTALAMMQKGGTARARVLEAQALGAQYGIRRGPALATVQAFQSQLGGWEQGKAGAREVFKLSALAGVPIDRAQMAVASGVGAGMTPSEAARWVYAAGEASALDAAKLAGLGPALPFFKGAKGGAGMGYAFAAALSGVFQDQFVPYTRGAGKALGAVPEQGAWGKYISQVPGHAGGDFMGMLRALKGRGITTTQDLAKVGLIEVRQAGALAAMLGNMEATEAAVGLTQTLAGQPGLITGRRAGAEAGFPELAFGRESAILDAALAAERATPSTTGGKALAAAGMRDVKLRKARALTMQLYGAGQFLGPEQTEASWADWWLQAGLFGRHVMFGKPGGTAPSMATAAERIAGASPDEIPVVLRDIRDSLERIEQDRAAGAPNAPEGVTR